MMPSPKSILRRCHSQPVQHNLSGTTSYTTIPPPPPPPRLLPHQRYPWQRDVAIQCTIIRWSSADNRVITEFDQRDASGGVVGLPRGGVDQRGFPGSSTCVYDSSSPELSITATDGSGATIDWTPPRHGPSFFGYYPYKDSTSSRASLYCHSAPPTRSATRVEQLLLEHFERDAAASTGTGGGGAGHGGCAGAWQHCGATGVAQSEPDMDSAAVRCCAMSSASTMVRVAALRGQFKRRKAVTLTDFDAETTTITRLSDAAATGEIVRDLSGGGGYTGHKRSAKRYQSATSLCSSWSLAPHSLHTEQSVDTTTVSASDLGMRSDTLLSPRISPLLWLQQCLPSLIVTTDHGGKSCGSSSTSIRDAQMRQLLGVPRSEFRRGSVDPNATDESETDQSPSLPRRGRRSAIFDTKSLGLASAPDDGDVSPSPPNSCDENETSNLLSADRPRTRKRSSADLGINYPGDLLSQVRPKRSTTGQPSDVPPLLKWNTIGDFADSLPCHQSTTASPVPNQLDQGEKKIAVPNRMLSAEKKLKKTFSLRKLIDKKSHHSKDNLPDMSDVMKNLKRSEFKDNTLMGYKNAHWMDLIASKEDTSPRPVTENERKRREAVWELFQSECIFLIDHLMVLKHCFMEPMKKVQVEGYLMYTEPQQLYGNLDELCYISYTFSRDFVSLLLKDDLRVNEFGRTPVLIKGLKRFAQLTRDGEVYHDYCLNYSKAITYLEQLRRNEDFCEFEKWCSQDQRCNRLQLTDLLISPMQHCTKVPLLLNNIRRYTENSEEQQLLTDSIEKLETSINDLETKMVWLKNYERVQEIQRQIMWQPIAELEPRTFIPEFLRMTLSRQPCERLLTSPRRQLLCEGPVTLLEISKTVDMYMFLFDDILLLTKIKKGARKKPNMAETSPGYNQPKAQTEGVVFVVHRQPIALDRFVIHDVRPNDTAGESPGLVRCSSLENVTPVDSDGNYHESCLPHFHDDCNRPSANLLFGCLSAANVLTNAFVLVQVSRFQQIIGVFTIQCPSEASKEIWLGRLYDAQECYKQACKRPENVIVKGSSLDSDGQTETALRMAALASTTDKKCRPSTSGTGTEKESIKTVWKPLLQTTAADVIGDETGSGEQLRYSRKIRSCSSDAATTTTESIPVSRRISDPVCHNDPSRCPSSTIWTGPGIRAGRNSGSSVGGGGLITTRAIVTATFEGPGRVPEVVVQGGKEAESGDGGSGRGRGAVVTPGAVQKRGMFHRRQTASPSFDDPPRSPAGSRHGSPEASAAGSPTMLRRSRHTSLRLRRRLKSINERSLSIEFVGSCSGQHQEPNKL